MRVLFQSELFWPYVGGIEVRSAQLLPALRARGHTFHVLTGTGHLDLPAEDRRESTPITRLPFRAAIEGADPLQIAALQARIVALKHSFRPDLIHLCGLGTKIYFHRGTASAAPAPTVVSVQNALPRRAAAEPSGVTQRVLRDADWVVACSDAVLDQLRAAVPAITSRSSTIVNGIDAPAREPSAVSFDPPVLVCLGRLMPQKGYDVALDAFAAIAGRHPAARLVIAGDGPERERLTRQAADAGLADRVEFLGLVPPDAVPALLERATLVLMPSRWEGLPVAAIQAALAARPVVASRVDGNVEIVRDGETGAVVPPESPAELAAAVERLLNDPDGTRRLGERARDHARARFSLAGCADAYDALYRRIGRSAVPA